MEIGGVSSAVSTAAAGTAATSNKAVENDTAAKSSVDTTAVVYEKSDAAKTDTAKKTYTPNTELVNKLKSDAQARVDQLQSLVNTLISKQGKTYANANVFTSDFWKQFSENGGTVDELAVKQAQEDISEDGYWGVNQTSSRILDFAKALCGGDPDKIDELEAAFEKGYKEATKSWGDELPSLCKDTYDAVKEGFADWRKENAASEE